MRSRIMSAVVCALLVSAGAEGQEFSFQGFLDPVENAFTLDVPQGWVVHGGTRRVSAVEPEFWVTAVSADGTMQAFIGDPALPPVFVEPFGTLREGDIAPTNGRIAPWPVLRYRHAADFARGYGAQSLPRLCSGVRVTGVSPLANYPHPPGEAAPNAEREGGSAMFSCTSNGTSYDAGVIAVTSIDLRLASAPPPVPGVPPGLWRQSPQLLWSVPLLAGFVAPGAQQDAAHQILDHMIASMRIDPEWLAAQHRLGQAEINQQNQESQGVLERQADWYRASTAMLLGYGEAAQASRMAQHDAFLAQQQDEADRRTQHFVANYLRRTINTNVFIHTVVQQQRLVCDQRACQWVPNR